MVDGEVVIGFLAAIKARKTSFTTGLNSKNSGGGWLYTGLKSNSGFVPWRENLRLRFCNLVINDKHM